MLSRESLYLGAGPPFLTDSRYHVFSSPGCEYPRCWAWFGSFAMSAFVWPGRWKKDRHCVGNGISFCVCVYVCGLFSRSLFLFCILSSCLGQAWCSYRFKCRLDVFVANVGVDQLDGSICGEGLEKCLAKFELLLLRPGRESAGVEGWQRHICPTCTSDYFFG